MKEWFTPAELAGKQLPGLPSDAASISRVADRAGWRKADLEYPRNPQGVWRKRQGRGGGYEYRPDVLPIAARAKLVYQSAPKAKKPAAEAISDTIIAERWKWYDSLPEKKKAKAVEAATVLKAVRELEVAGTTRTTARIMIANQHGVSTRTLLLWSEKVAGLPAIHWLPFLAPKHVGKALTDAAECHPEAWEAFCADYLRLEKPNFTDCYRRLEDLAQYRNWHIPTQSSLRRKMKREVPAQVILYCREGEEALKRTYPALQRDPLMFNAMQAVNADTHTWDLRVRFPGDKKATRPHIIAFQDLRTRKIVAWRITRQECREVMLLAIYDMIDAYGVPEFCILDNSGTFTSKWIVGGLPNRNKWKYREDEPTGIMKMLGIEVHFTMPYSGQSKPIERAFRDFAQVIAKHPAFAGAWTGNTIENQPENYGEKEIPFDQFEEIVAREIARHNARPGRLTDACKARKLSFDQAFEESYSADTTFVRKATAEQKRLCLLGAEGVTVQKYGHIEFMDNKYWAEELLAVENTRVILRFDPEDLHAGAFVYRLDGSFYCEVECREKAGFLSTESGRAHNRERRAYFNAQKKWAEAVKANWTPERYAEAIAAQGGVEPVQLPEKKTVRMVANGGFDPPSNNAFSEALAAAAAQMERDGGNVLPFPKEKSGP